MKPFDSFKLSQLRKPFESHDIQRGLVWSPRQIGLLWDSIFKGIPIGTIMLLMKDNEKQILDGQQRLNAISLGFSDCDNQQMEKVIWVNIRDNHNLSFMLTTISHPWGYNDNEDCSRLTADEQRNAVKSFLGRDYNDGDEWNIYRSDNLKLNCTWPYKSNLAIPLHVLIQAFETTNNEEYVQSVKSLYKDHFLSAYNHYTLLFGENKLDESIASLQELINNVLNYEVGATIVTLESLDDIELLFNRINKGGTQISEDELAYSTIKAYFSNVKDSDNLVAEFIEPSKLARIVFRIIETMVEKKHDGFVNNLSLQKIRERGKDDYYKSLIEDYYTDIANLLKSVDRIFKATNTPSILRSRIANQSSELYMLLMYIKRLNTKDSDVTDRILSGLTFYIKWFCNDVPRCVNIIKDYIDKEFTIKGIKLAIAHSINLSILTPLITPDSFETMMEIYAHDKWSPGLSQWNDLWNRVKENREMLLFFQREYINSCFCNYNPSISKMWSEHNTPWDYDHIIPQNWFPKYSEHNCFARFCKNHWLNNIGNLAAIPFEINRSKSDNNDDWNYYIQNNHYLRVNLNCIEKFSKYPDSITSKKIVALCFAQTTFKRCHLIYEECYKTLFKQLVLSSDDITPLAKDRKRLFLKIQDKIKGVKYYYVTQDNSIEQLIDDNSGWEWNMPWMSFGIVLKDLYYIAVAIGIEDDKLVYEIGVRKSPKAISIDEVNSLDTIKGYNKYNEGWWYIERDLSEDQFNCLNIPEEFNKLSELIR